MIIPIRELILREGDRNPHANVALQKLKAGRHHAHDSVLLIVQQDVSPDYSRVASVTTLPQSVAENRDFVRSRFVFLDREVSPCDWLNAEQWKEIGSHSVRQNSLRLSIASKIEVLPIERGHILERLILRFPIHVVGWRHVTAGKA